MARFKTRRQARYDDLRRQHFTHAESLQFSRLKRKYPALQQMRRVRRGQWAGFTRYADNRGLSPAARAKEWERRIAEFYDTWRFKTGRDKDTGLTATRLTNWLVRKDVHGRPIKTTISPWEWYDSVFNNLPDELRWDTPRSHRTKGDQGEVKIDKIKARRWIADLEKSIARTDDPASKAQFREQIKNLRSTVRRS